MPRVVLIVIVCCFFPVCGMAQSESLPTEQPKEAKQIEYQPGILDIYRAAAPFVAKIEPTIKRGATTVTFNVENILNSYPESMRPWKPEELKNMKILLPLGEGESIDDKLYRFLAEWDIEDEKADDPLIIHDIGFFDHSRFYTDKETPPLSPCFRYRPIELLKDDVIRCKFEFRPIRYRHLTEPPQSYDMAPVPEFLAPLAIHTAQLKVLINGKKQGFSIHFSRDGEKWYSQREMGLMPFQMLPFETLHLRIATEDKKPITKAMIDFEAILETHGFRGSGETLAGNLSRMKGNQARNVDCPLAFFDDTGDLVICIDNNEEEPFSTSSLLAHNYQSMERFQGCPLGGGFNADGFIMGRNIAANSMGIFTLPISKDEPGHHTYIYFWFRWMEFQSVVDFARNGSNRPQPLAGLFADSHRKNSRRGIHTGRGGISDI